MVSHSRTHNCCPQLPIFKWKTVFWSKELFSWIPCQQLKHSESSNEKLRERKPKPHLEHLSVLAGMNFVFLGREDLNLIDLPSGG